MGAKQEIGERIQALRKRHGLTQPELAALLGRSPDTISSLERGITAPNFVTLERLSERLNVPMKHFFDFDLDPKERERTVKINRIVRAAEQLHGPELDSVAAKIEQMANSRERCRRD